MPDLYHHSSMPGLSFCFFGCLEASEVYVLGSFWLQYLGAHPHPLPLLQRDRVRAARAPWQN